MLILPERFVRFALRDLIEKRKHLDRAAEYDKWIIEVQAYYKENYPYVTPEYLQTEKNEMMRKFVEKTKTEMQED